VALVAVTFRIDPILKEDKGSVEKIGSAMVNAYGIHSVPGSAGLSLGLLPAFLALAR
jgi:hypothetical protein